MKTSIAILGSTGSIGKQTLEIVKSHKKNFNVVLLSTNSNIKEIENQVKIFNPKNLIISNKDKFIYFKKKNKIKNVIFLMTFTLTKKFFQKKLIML